MPCVADGLNDVYTTLSDLLLKLNKLKWNNLRMTMCILKRRVSSFCSWNFMHIGAGMLKLQ